MSHRRPLCRLCWKRPALILVRCIRPKVVKGHDLCRQCWRTIQDSYAGWRAAQVARRVGR